MNQKKVMPQEIEVWYLIPALRRELAQILISNHNQNQKDTAVILGITEAAISQYLNSKRGKEIKFSREEMREIKKAAEEIIKDKESMMKHLYALCVKFRKSKVICDIHKNQDSTIPKNCDYCFEGE